MDQEQLAQPQYPRRGQVIRNFALLSAAGHQVQLSDYRGRANLVLVLAGGECGENGFALLDELAVRQAQILEEEAQVIAVLACAREPAQAIKSRRHWPFVVLADSEAAVHRSLGALDGRGSPHLAVYVTDRYGEVFTVFRTAQGEPTLTASEILGWLEFVNRQCPECFPPE